MRKEEEGLNEKEEEEKTDYYALMKDKKWIAEQHAKNQNKKDLEKA